MCIRDRLDSSDSLHIVEAHALDSNGAYMNNQSNFKVFEKVVATPSPTPTATPKPTVSPTSKPTQTPTAAPTDKPTDVPDYTPTATPGDKSTAAPECSPTAAPDGSPTDTDVYKRQVRDCEWCRLNCYHSQFSHNRY